MKKSGKMNGVTKHRDPLLSTDDHIDFVRAHDAISRRQTVQRNSIDTQDYLDHLADAHGSYTAAMTAIKSNLSAAVDGLSRINEKGMSDKIIESINQIAEIRQKQIAVTNGYASQLASLDSDRAAVLRKNSDSKDQFIINKFESDIKAKNAVLQKTLADLDTEYRDSENSLTINANGQSRTPTDTEVLDVRKKQDGILAKKQQLAEEYAIYLEKVAAERDDVLNGTGKYADSKAKNAEVSDMDDIINQTLPVAENNILSRKKSKITDAFAAAEKSSGSLWKKFTSLPVIAGITAAAERHIKPKVDDFKSDFVAGYAVMKEHKQMRKLEQDLEKLDELQARTGENSYALKFRDFLQNKAEPAKQEDPVPMVSDIPIDYKPIIITKTDAYNPLDLVTETETPAPEPEKPKENQHDARIRKAGNKAALLAVRNTNIGSIINDYYWSDQAETHDIMAELGKSENVMIDLTQYTDRLKKVIGHFPNSMVRESMLQKISEAMTTVYHDKSEAEKKVSIAESRIKDSEIFLSGLDSGEDMTEREL